MTKQENKLKTISTGKCPTLSGKGELRYAIQADGKGHHFLTLLSNSNPGQFNVNEPVSITDITGLLSKVSPTANITSLHISSLFRGSSSNNSGFMLAVLKHLGLIIQEDPEKPRSHKLNPDYEEKIKALSSPIIKRPVRKKASRKRAVGRSRKLINGS